jgi:hypothetical protein
MSIAQKIGRKPEKPPYLKKGKEMEKYGVKVVYHLLVWMSRKKPSAKIEGFFIRRRVKMMG